MGDAYQDAIRILEENRELLDKIAEYLLKKETITGQEMMAIIEGRDPETVDNFGATREERRARLSGDVEPPARSVRMISQPPVNPFLEEETASDEGEDEDETEEE